MVAIHQAARALQAGDCRSALVGGVNVISSPDVSKSFHFPQFSLEKRKKKKKKAVHDALQANGATFLKSL